MALGGTPADNCIATASGPYMRDGRGKTTSTWSPAPVATFDTSAANGMPDNNVSNEPAKPRIVSSVLGRRSSVAAACGAPEEATASRVPGSAANASNSSSARLATRPPAATSDANSAMRPTRAAAVTDDLLEATAVAKTSSDTKLAECCNGACAPRNARNSCECNRCDTSDKLANRLNADDAKVEPNAAPTEGAAT